jgi:hypothetical protein
MGMRSQRESLARSRSGRLGRVEAEAEEERAEGPEIEEEGSEKGAEWLVGWEEELRSRRCSSARGWAGGSPSSSSRFVGLVLLEENEEAREKPDEEVREGRWEREDVRPKALELLFWLLAVEIDPDAEGTAEEEREERDEGGWEK